MVMGWRRWSIFTGVMFLEQFCRGGVVGSGLIGAVLLVVVAVLSCRGDVHQPLRWEYFAFLIDLRVCWVRHNRLWLSQSYVGQQKGRGHSQKLQAAVVDSCRHGSLYFPLCIVPVLYHYCTSSNNNVIIKYMDVRRGLLCVRKCWFEVKQCGFMIFVCGFFCDGVDGSEVSVQPQPLFSGSSLFLFVIFSLFFSFLGELSERSFVCLRPFIFFLLFVACWFSIFPFFSFFDVFSAVVSCRGYTPSRYRIWHHIIWWCAAMPIFLF